MVPFKWYSSIRCSHPFNFQSRISSSNCDPRRRRRRCYGLARKSKGKSPFPRKLERATVSKNPKKTRGILYLVGPAVVLNSWQDRRSSLRLSQISRCPGALLSPPLSKPLEFLLSVLYKWKIEDSLFTLSSRWREVDWTTRKGIGGIYIFSVAIFFNIVFRLPFFLFYLLFVNAGLMKYFNFSFVYHLHYGSGNLKRWWILKRNNWNLDIRIHDNWIFVNNIYIISICLILNG